MQEYLYIWYSFPIVSNYYYGLDDNHFILDLGAKWKWVINLNLRQLYPRRNIPESIE
jgi:hypothetical protein